MTDKFSKKVINELFSRFPEWQQYRREETGEDGNSYFVVEIPTPKEADGHGPLLITTCDEEVTVGFDYYHGHFDDMTNDDECQDNTAIGFIIKLLSEQIAVVSLWKGDKWMGSRIVNAGEEPRKNSSEQQCDRVRIRSWLGTLNKDRRV